MVFVWTGRGYWSALFPILFPWVLGVVIDNGFGDQVLEGQGWVYGVAVLAAAGANWVCGRRWNGTEGLRPWDLGAALRRRREHTAFGAPMEFWSLPLAIGGVWLILANLPGQGG